MEQTLALHLSNVDISVERLSTAGWCSPCSRQILSAASPTKAKNVTSATTRNGPQQQQQCQQRQHVSRHGQQTNIGSKCS